MNEISLRFVMSHVYLGVECLKLTPSTGIPTQLPHTANADKGGPSLSHSLAVLRVCTVHRPTATVSVLQKTNTTCEGNCGVGGGKEDQMNRQLSEWVDADARTGEPTSE